MWPISVLNAYVVIAMVHAANAFLEQSVRVRGRLLCGSQPASSILVKLVDKDNGNKAFVFLYNYTPLLFRVFFLVSVPSLQILLSITSFPIGRVIDISIATLTVINSHL